MMELTTLVERATQGDATAFEHLVTQHWGCVYTICLSQVGQAAQAEDLTQEVFMRVSRGCGRLRAMCAACGGSTRPLSHWTPWLSQKPGGRGVVQAVGAGGDRAGDARPTVTHEPRGAGPALSGGLLSGRAGGGVWGVAVGHQESPA